MATFIGAEHLMALGLISKLRNGENAITFNELRQTGRQLQDELNQLGVDAVVMTDFTDALFEYDDYFSAIDINGNNYCKCAMGVGLCDLERRFVGCLSFDVLKIMTQYISEDLY